MQKVYKVAIIGGGSAGLVSAIELTQGDNKINGDDIIVLEKNDRVLKKLIATGNGQANLSNANLSKDNYYGDTRFIDAYFNAKSDFDVEKFFLNLGLPFTTLSDGRKYPLSRQANAVVDVLRFTSAERKVETLTDFTVKKICFKNDVFIVSGSRDIYAENVILAVGGKASPSFGTDGSSYVLAESFGHKTTVLYPSLVQIKTEKLKIKGLKGIKEYVRITAFDGKTPLKVACGDVLFTDYGVSGSGVFQVSGHLAKAQNPKIKIEFLPDLSEKELCSLLNDRKNKLSFLPEKDALLGILHKKLGQVIVSTQTDFSPEALAKTLKNYTLSVSGTLGFDNAQVTKGGVDTDFINPGSFESKLQKGLYFVGEVLNVDGDCGGYNLDFAFTSAVLSARNIKSQA